MSKQRSRLATAVASFKKRHMPCSVCRLDDVAEIDRLHSEEGYGATHIYFGLRQILGDGIGVTVPMLNNHFRSGHSLSAKKG